MQAIIVELFPLFQSFYVSGLGKKIIRLYCSDGLAMFQSFYVSGLGKKWSYRGCVLCVVVLFQSFYVSGLGKKIIFLKGSFNFSGCFNPSMSVD